MVARGLTQNDVQLQDQPAMDARLAKVVGHALGCGMLEGTTKQQLATVEQATEVNELARTVTKFDSVEDTTTPKGLVKCKHLAGTSSVGCDLVASDLRARSVVVFTYKRILSKRMIAVPQYDTLLPVRQGKPVGKPRWLVEQHGNELCTTEFYGAELRIAFTWRREAALSIADVIDAVRMTAATATVQRRRFDKWEAADVHCRAHNEGFELPDGDLSTVSGIIELIRKLNQLPVRSAVAVDHDTVPIHSLEGFPSGVHVETKIRDLPTLEELAELQLHVQSTEPVNVATCEFLDHLHYAVEDAALHNRPALPPLRELVAKVVAKLSQHGKCVALYKRGDRLRLLEDNCDTRNLTAKGTETLVLLTLGLAIPFVWGYQYFCFRSAPVWTPPESYKTKQFTTTGRVYGYYERNKVRELFDDNDQLRKWRREADALGGPRVSAGRFSAHT